MGESRRRTDTQRGHGQRGILEPARSCRYELQRSVPDGGDTTVSLRLSRWAGRCGDERHHICRQSGRARAE